MFAHVFILAAVLLLTYLWKQRNSYALYWKLSGPVGYPIIGNSLMFKDPNAVLQTFTKMEKKFKSPYALWMGPQLVVMSNDPDTMETILTSPKCVNRSFVYSFISEMVGQGLFSSNSPVWNTHVKMIKPTFKRKMILAFYSIFNEEASELCARIDENLNNEKFSLFHFMQLATIKATCQTTLGDSHSDLEKLDFKQILKAFSSLMVAMVDRIFTPLYYETTIYKLTQHYKNALPHKHYIKEMLLRKICSKKKEMEEKSVNSATLDEENEDLNFKLPASLLEYILVKNESNLTLDELCDEATVLIAAGFETTAIGLYITIVCLAMHPEEQNRLYDELSSVFPDKEFDVTEEHLKQLTYTKMCVDEAMRVIAPVPIVGRYIMEDIKLKSGIVLPKGTEIMLDIFNMQRSEKNWGPRAKVFDPENFHPDNLKSHHPYSYIPFTKGLRMCVGFSYSLTLMKIFLAKIFRNYKITSDEKFENLQFVENISIKFRNPPTLQIEKR